MNTSWSGESSNADNSHQGDPQYISIITNILVISFIIVGTFGINKTRKIYPHD